MFLTAISGGAKSHTPSWRDLPAGPKVAIEAEGIGEAEYVSLMNGEIITRQRLIPAGKSGVHVAAFGTVNGSIDKLWSAITDCSELAKFMPNIESCVEVQPDHELPPNERWYRLQLSFCGCLVFKKTINVINHTTMKPPYYLCWQLVKGDLKTNEGYYRIVTINPNLHLVVYDAMTDPGVPLPENVLSWFSQRSLQGVITALRGWVAVEK